MTSNRAVAPVATTIKLPVTLDLAAARSLLHALRESLASGTGITLDASAVEGLSVPGLQVVLAALKAPRPAGIRDPSISFTRAFLEYGLDWPPPAPNDDAPRTATPGSKPVTAEDDVAWSEDEPAVQPTSAKRVLTIDDSKTMRDMLMLTLAGGGFDVLQAVDGKDGLDMLDHERVDVIITDINMPRMDGYEVIRNLRARQEFAATPILVLTTESDTEKKQRARDLGATGFIVKPFNPVSLVEVIHKVAP